MTQEPIKIDPYLLTAIVNYLGRLPGSVHDLYPIKRLLCGSSRFPLKQYLKSQGVPNFLTLQQGAWESVRLMGKLRTFEVHRYLVNDYGFLKDCKNLESISVMPQQWQPFDCTLLQEMPWLRSAELFGCKLLHPEALIEPEPLPFSVRYHPSEVFPMLEGIPIQLFPAKKTLPPTLDVSPGDCLLCWTERVDNTSWSDSDSEIHLLHACRPDSVQAAGIAQKIGEGVHRWVWGRRGEASLHIQWEKKGAVLEYQRGEQRLLCWNKRAKSWMGYLCKDSKLIEQILLYFCQTGQPFPGASWAVPGEPPKI